MKRRKDKKIGTVESFQVVNVCGSVDLVDEEVEEVSVEH